MPIDRDTVIQLRTIRQIRDRLQDIEGINQKGLKEMSQVECRLVGKLAEEKHT